MKHRVKKLISLILAFAMVIAPAIPAATVHADWETRGDRSWYDGHESDTEFLIGSAEEFAALIKLVNEDKVYFENKTIRLTNDIDLSSDTCTEIGTSVADGFKGTIEGDGHVITAPASMTSGKLFYNVGAARNLGWVVRGNRRMDLWHECGEGTSIENGYAYSPDGNAQFGGATEKKTFTGSQPVQSSPLPIRIGIQPGDIQK